MARLNHFLTTVRCINSTLQQLEQGGPSLNCLIDLWIWICKCLGDNLLKQTLQMMNQTRSHDEFQLLILTHGYVTVYVGLSKVQSCRIQTRFLFYSS
jgi:hypothetical protein